MPAYKHIFEKNFKLELIAENMSCRLNKASIIDFDLYRTNHEGIDFILSAMMIFSRDNLYGTQRVTIPIIT